MFFELDTNSEEIRTQKFLKTLVLPGYRSFFTLKVPVS